MARALLRFEIRFAPVSGHAQLGAALLLSADFVAKVAGDR
jgi:hypothetical protein